MGNYSAIATTLFVRTLKQSADNFIGGVVVLFGSLYDL